MNGHGALAKFAISPTYICLKHIFNIDKAPLPSARWAALARFNSQFTLQVFEPHALAARVILVGATHRLDFLR